MEWIILAFIFWLFVGFFVVLLSKEARFILKNQKDNRKITIIFLSSVALWPFYWYVMAFFNSYFDDSTGYE